MVRKFYDTDLHGGGSSIPSVGRTFEKILEEDYHVQLEDNRRDESIKLAAEKYASQYAHQQPDGAVDALECTCKLTDKNHALCPVCDKEEYKKSVEQRNDAIKNVDERTTNKELISFLISPKKPFKINIVRDLFNQYYQEEISLSRLNERLNEIVFYWKQPVQGYSREDIIALLDWLTKEDSPYAVCYGSETRFATTQDDLTTEQVFEVWNKIY